MRLFSIVSLLFSITTMASVAISSRQFPPNRRFYNIWGWLYCLDRGTMEYKPLPYFNVSINYFYRSAMKYRRALNWTMTDEQGQFNIRGDVPCYPYLNIRHTCNPKCVVETRIGLDRYNDEGKTQYDYYICLGGEQEKAYYRSQLRVETVKQYCQDELPTTEPPRPINDPNGIWAMCSRQPTVTR